MWLTEVVLFGGDEPWVTAHTLVPVSSLNGPLRRVKSLKNNPLENFLFASPLLVRETLEVVRTEDGWGRRSLFKLYGHPILVAEFFLPALIRT